MAEEIKNKEEVSPTSETVPQKSKRDLFRERIGTRYPELNMDDEDS